MKHKGFSVVALVGNRQAGTAEKAGIEVSVIHTEHHATEIVLKRRSFPNGGKAALGNEGLEQAALHPLVQPPLPIVPAHQRSGHHPFALSQPIRFQDIGILVFIGIGGHFQIGGNGMGGQEGGVIGLQAGTGETGIQPQGQEAFVVDEEGIAEFAHKPS